MSLSCSPPGNLLYLVLHLILARLKFVYLSMMTIEPNIIPLPIEMEGEDNALQN